MDLACRFVVLQLTQQVFVLHALYHKGGTGFEEILHVSDRTISIFLKKEEEKDHSKNTVFLPNTESMNQIRRYITIVKKFAER